MRLDTLEKRMLYYRSLTDYKLLPNAPVLLMLDGRAFSKFCKRCEKFSHNNEKLNKIGRKITNVIVFTKKEQITAYKSRICSF